MLGKLKYPKSRIPMKIVTLIISALIVLLIFFGTPFIIHQLYPNINDAGSFGDSYGILSTLFTALAFAFLIYTAWMQNIQNLL